MRHRRALVGPWFSRRPRVAAVAVSVLFAAITAVRLGFGDERDATAMLYTLPVALAGTAFGRRAGLFAAVGGVALVVTWAALDSVSLTVTGWVARIVPLVLVGWLVGDASERQREAEAVRLALVVAEAHRRDAAEIHDAIAQRLAVAKWRLEAGDCHAALVDVCQVMDATETLVGGLLGGEPPAERRRVRSIGGGAGCRAGGGGRESNPPDGDHPAHPL